MTPWEFAAKIEGWNKFHGDNKPAPPTEEEYEEAVRQYQMNYGTVH
jgi:hypothetical protein